ncbi:MAG TPA: hypothetical protein VFU40_08295, partial [Gemmatimonadales bacterium]|nr:hypothetical protein [Gemmatimonadales bacterium]
LAQPRGRARGDARAGRPLAGPRPRPGSGRRMNDLEAWLECHTRHAPAALSERVKEFVLPAEGVTHAAALAKAGQSALGRVLAHPGDRSAALDLLAADALITLALLAQAEAAPERLEEFATSVLRTSRPDA